MTFSPTPPEAPAGMVRLLVVNSLEVSMNNVRQPRIVVGVSGSRASAAALRWAADEAQRCNGQLRIVRIWEAECSAAYAPRRQREPEQQQARAASELAATVREAFGARPPDNVIVELAEGKAERALVERSAGADLLVLGSKSPPSLAGHSIGAVIRTCLSRAHCPVVVVARATTDDPEAAGDLTRSRVAGPPTAQGGQPRRPSRQPVSH